MDLDEGAADYGHPRDVASYDWQNGDYDDRYDAIDSPNLTGKESDSPRDEIEGYGEKGSRVRTFRQAPPQGHDYGVQYRNPKVRLPRPNSPHRKLLHSSTIARHVSDLYPPRAQLYPPQPCAQDQYQTEPFDSQHPPRVFLGRDGRLYKAEPGYQKTIAGKRYPVTVKTSRYSTKRPMTSPLNKKTSMVCLPSTFRDDQYRSYSTKPKIFHQIDAGYDVVDSHPIHSQEDANPAVGEAENQCCEYAENPILRNGDNSIKQFAKYLKPKVPASIRARQDRNAKISTPDGTNGPPGNDSMVNLDHVDRAEDSSLHHSDENKDEGRINIQKDDLTRSFNYETIARKIVPLKRNPSKSISYLPQKTTTSLTTSLDRKPSVRSLKVLDDHGALELHRCKSYIVDLIDRALSRELGTVPRDTKLDRRMSPKKAIDAIGHHSSAPLKNELCYEVTAALADSFVSSATAPRGGEEQGDEPDPKNKICPCTSESSREKYFKQLRHLRWGHIKHIQHEVRRLADLEEFLDKIDESEF
ncbi:uncharacterized protein LOC132703450 isoform X2 [Cylas formicarius]|uniref:uncharacterized protein LOC132703450 isoform X2 n=1 Tax=Cylas formicarius TaxID=197179 RepID=UPI0029585CC0|nr:uncharacterized protein LOC132703450 isoform X2 [Cylas formicarius]